MPTKNENGIWTPPAVGPRFETYFGIVLRGESGIWHIGLLEGEQRFCEQYLGKICIAHGHPVMRHGLLSLTAFVLVLLSVFGLR
jgi:hypothetical protein